LVQDEELGGDSSPSGAAGFISRRLSAASGHGANLEREGLSQAPTPDLIKPSLENSLLASLVSHSHRILLLDTFR
jgi:hypothetical protein